MLKSCRNKFDLNWGWLFVIILFIAPPFALFSQSEARIKNAYNHYQKTGNENHLRFQLINELNFPDFLAGGNFLKNQNHPRSLEIMIDVLKSYNRFDLLEQVLFSNPNEPYRINYKELYYQTLLSNLKSDTLLNILLSRIEKLNQRMGNIQNEQEVNPDEISKLIYFELRFLQEIARKGERQISQWEERIRNFSFSPPKKRKKEIIFNHFYAALEKKKFLKKVYQSLITFSTKPVSQKPKKEIKKIILTNQENNYDLLNSAENFFDFEKTKSEIPEGKPLPLEKIDTSGVVYTVIQNKTETDFLNLLYRRGYYRNYLHLVKTLAQKFSVDSLKYKRFIKKYRVRISRARLYTKSPDFKEVSQVIPLRKLFFQNEYQKIIDDYTNFQQHDYYLLALAAQGQWTTLFQITQNNSELTANYRILSLLSQSPDELLNRLKAQPSEKLSAWQLDFLNLVEEGLSPKEIAPVFLDFFFKKKNTLSRLNTIKALPLLYEYGITLQAQTYLNNGEPQKVRKIFRNHYNQMKAPSLKERLMFLHGISHLNENPIEAEKILYRLLTLNPQSPYRFDIEEALNSLL